MRREGERRRRGERKGEWINLPSVNFPNDCRAGLCQVEDKSGAPFPTWLQGAKHLAKSVAFPDTLAGS